MPLKNKIRRDKNNTCIRKEGGINQIKDTNFSSKIDY